MRLTLIAVAVGLAGTGLLVERQLHEQEARAVADCVAETAAAIDQAGRRVETTYDYVRPALANAPRPALKQGLLGLVAEAAEGSAARLATTRDSCSDVSVLFLHTPLRAQRDRCVEVIDAQRSALDAVAGDGEQVQAWLEAPRSC